eukprot:11776641-Prorocentrum_lima.AAC.1
MCIRDRRRIPQRSSEAPAIAPPSPGGATAPGGAPRSPPSPWRREPASSDTPAGAPAAGGSSQ